MYPRESDGLMVLTPQFQTTFGDGSDGTEPGNCWAACIATITGIPLAEMPNFITKHDRWFEATQDWLSERGWGIVMMDWPETVYAGKFPRTHVILSGYNAKTGLRHSIVGLVENDMEGYPHVSLVHDPLPDGKGLLPERTGQVLTFLFRLI